MPSMLSHLNPAKVRTFYNCRNFEGLRTLTQGKFSSHGRFIILTSEESAVIIYIMPILKGTGFLVCMAEYLNNTLNTNHPPTRRTEEQVSQLLVEKAEAYDNIELYE